MYSVWFCASLFKSLLSIAVPNTGKFILTYSRIDFWFPNKVNFRTSTYWSSLIESLARLLLKIQSWSILLVTHVIALLILHSEKTLLFGKFNVVITVNHAHLSLGDRCSFKSLWFVFVSRILWIYVTIKKRLDHFGFGIL